MIITVYEMAQLVAERCTGNQIKVKVKIEDRNKFGFAPTLRMNLDITKLKNWAGGLKWG
jgi:hypothetical protein